LSTTFLGTLRFDLVLSDVSAFLFDGDYHWSQVSLNKSAHSTNSGFFPIIGVEAVSIISGKVHKHKKVRQCHSAN